MRQRRGRTFGADAQKETRAEGIDGIRAYTHNYGCSQLGDDHEHTRRILRDMALHPNAGGVLIIGLGCENNQPDAFRALLGDYDTERIRFMVCQHEEDEMERDEDSPGFICPDGGGPPDRSTDEETESGTQMRRFRRFFRHYG